MMSAAQAFLQNDKIPIPLEGKMALLLAFFVVQGTLVGTNLEINGLAGTFEATLGAYLLKLAGGGNAGVKYLPVPFFSPALKTFFDSRLMQFNSNCNQIFNYMVQDHTACRIRFAGSCSSNIKTQLTLATGTAIATASSSTLTLGCSLAVLVGGTIALTGVGVVASLMLFQTANRRPVKYLKNNDIVIDVDFEMDID